MLKNPIYRVILGQRLLSITKVGEGSIPTLSQSFFFVSHFITESFFKNIYFEDGAYYSIMTGDGNGGTQPFFRIAISVVEK